MVQKFAFCNYVSLLCSCLLQIAHHSDFLQSFHQQILIARTCIQHFGELHQIIWYNNVEVSEVRYPECMHEYFYLYCN